MCPPLSLMDSHIIGTALRAGSFPEQILGLWLEAGRWVPSGCAGHGGPGRSRGVWAPLKEWPGQMGILVRALGLGVGVSIVRTLLSAFHAGLNVRQHATRPSGSSPMGKLRPREKLA